MIEYSSRELLDKHIDISMLDIYLDLVEKANRSFSLYSRNLKKTDLREMIADSLIPLELNWIKNSNTILDIGSGWGIPAIPYLLAIPELKITLVERSRKKADFMALVLNRLCLKADIKNQDISEISNQNIYSLIVSRRVNIDGKIFPHIKKFTEDNSRLIYYGPNFPKDLCNPIQMVEYKLDNSAQKKITLSEI